jgi:UV DNA damage endonuclease
LHKKLKKLGELFLTNNIRVTCHPGQFTIINSNEDRVIVNAIKELEYHAWMFDVMGLERSPYYAINIHGGKRGNFDKLVETINTRLPHNVKSRLTLENDEKCFSVRELVEVNKATGVPVVFDSHHFTFNQDGMDMVEAFNASYDTWQASDCKPIQHLSNTEPGMEDGSFSERRKHSWDIHYIPNPQLIGLSYDMIDVDVEAKGKNIALLNTRKKFNIM